MDSLRSTFAISVGFYRLLGLHWYTPEPDFAGHCWTAFYVACNFCFISALFGWIYRHQAEILFSASFQGFLVDFTKFVLLVVVYNTLIAENWYNVDKLRNVWQELEQMRTRCTIASARWAGLQRHHLLVVIGFLVFQSWWELSYAYVVSYAQRDRIFTIVFWILIMLLHLRQLQIMFYTDLVGFCLREMNHQLRWTIELSRGASRYGGRLTDGQICTQLATLADAFARVVRLVALLNRAFGYSFAMVKLITHVYLLTDTYWIVYAILRGMVFEGLYLECCLMSKVICLMLNLRSNERIGREAVLMRELLHRVDLGWQLRCETGYQMVHHFLLQMDSCRSLRLTAMSLYAMDYSVMMQIIFSVTASISLFIQAFE